MSRTITNELGLPQAIVDAVRNDDYDRGASDITVTQLLDPPRKVALIAAHADEIVEDASDRIYALMGQAIHTVLERANVADSVEERLYTDVMGWKVGGRFDTVALMPDPEFGHILSDYKNVSRYEITHGIKPERHAQLNVLGLLAKQAGYTVDRLEAVCIVRDWSRGEARRKADYFPKKQVVRYFVPMWDEAQVVAYITDRVLIHQAALETLPECSDDERWYKGTTWAVRKKKNKRATRVLNSYEEAFTWARENKATVSAQFGTVIDEALHKDYVIEERPGENTRCLDYCDALPWCEQGQALIKVESLTGEEVADA
jgi:hypothetical protein